MSVRNRITTERKYLRVSHLLNHQRLHKLYTVLAWIILDARWTIPQKITLNAEFVVPSLVWINVVHDRPCLNCFFSAGFKDWTIKPDNDRFKADKDYFGFIEIFLLQGL